MRANRPEIDPVVHLSRRTWLISCLLILIGYYVTRLPHLLTFPLFIDEATHLTRAQDVWQGQPLELFLNGKAGPLYLIALFDPFHAPIALGRIVIALIGGLGVSSSIGVGRLLGGSLAGLLAGLFWVACPFLFFYERMILVDAPLAALAAFATWTAIRMMRTGRVVDALLCGFALALCAFDKVTGLVFFFVPVAVFILPGLISWRTAGIRIRQIAIAYGLAALLMIVPVLFIISQQDNILGVGALTTVSSSGLGERLSTNLSGAFDAFRDYFSPTLLALLIAGAVYGLIDRPRRGLIILALAIVPLLALTAVGAMLYFRYLVIAVPGLLILSAIGWTAFATQVARWIHLLNTIRLPLILPGAIGLVALAILIPFMQTAYTDPPALPLPTADQREYVWEWSGGYGLREAAFDLMARAAADHKPVTAIGLVGSCNIARLYVPIDSLVTILCPNVWDPSGAGMRVGDSEIAAQQAATGTALIFAEESGPVNMSFVPEPRRLIQSYSRPTGENTVELFAVP